MAGGLFVNSGGGEWSVRQQTDRLQNRERTGQILTDSVKDIREIWVLKRDSFHLGSQPSIGHTRKAVSIIEGAVMRELRHSLYANGGFD